MNPFCAELRPLLRCSVRPWQEWDTLSRVPSAARGCSRSRVAVESLERPLQPRMRFVFAHSILPHSHLASFPFQFCFQTSRLPPSAGSLTPTTSKSSFLGRSFSTVQMGPGSAPASGIMAAPESPYGTLKRGAPGRGSSTRLTPYK